jgi:alpha-tubulin suppressor-like RCC1 family protein
MGYDMKDIGLLAALMLAAVASAGCHDQESPVESDTVLATAAAAPLSFFQVSSNDHACGVTSDSRLYCWGRNDHGGIGDGTTIDRVRPVPVAPSLRFKAVSVSAAYTCAVTTDSRLFCWGDNSFGQLGDGTTTRHLTPHQVPGTRAYRQVDVGQAHACAVAAADNRAYCWGWNDNGQLGHGTDEEMNPTPTAVAGGRQFRQVQAGALHSCGVTTSNVAFCWGSNRFGELGDSSSAPGFEYSPVRVAGSRQFVQIDAGTGFTCAVTSSSRAWCWGDGRSGQIGDGSNKLRFWPRAVAGGLTFRRVSTGSTHACGETPSSKVYCWGNNPFGGVGDGTAGTDRLRPVAVGGGLNFGQVSAGDGGTCGKTQAGVGYCWGWNKYGQLGDGTHTDRFRPVKIVAP